MKRNTVEERRAEILRTTCEVVIERGFGGTRIADVANKLGVSTGLIHYHFESKEHLLAEAFKFAAREERDSLEEDLGSAPNSVARLDRLIKNYTPKPDDLDWLMWIDSWGEALRNPVMRSISQELDIESTGVIERVIREGVERGEFRCEDPTATAWRLAALLDGLGVQLTVHDGMLTRNQMVKHVQSAALAELGLEPDAFAAKNLRRRRAPVETR
ncbi:MAG: TetR/AcrR family transcriptional regulator [Ilumatobacteraceae bacterium]